MSAAVFPSNASVECLEVPALSSEMRLPDVRPSDSTGENQLTFVAARGELEPASFVMLGQNDIDKLELRASLLKSDSGEIPAHLLDIKVVKCWYQAGTAWYSYFSDPSRRELVPELLLNDETLVKVDHEKRDNHLRIGDEYSWISYSSREGRPYFDYLREPVKDADTLQPVALEKGRYKQIWVTLEVPLDAAPGLYEGSISLWNGDAQVGNVTLKARVLPFSLPRPKTYYDLDQPYFVTIYSTGVLALADTLKVPAEVAERQQKAIYRNLLRHNVYNPMAHINLAAHKDRDGGLALLKKELDLMVEAGLDTKPLFSREMMWKTPPEEANAGMLRERLKQFSEVVAERLGHRDVYVATWDEANAERVRTMRGLVDEIHALGFKLWVTTARDRHLPLAGYMIDYSNASGWPERQYAAQWHAVGAKIASYAGPHTGPENPDVFRRWEGLARYKANYDGSFNYKYYSTLHPTLYKRQKENVWNDFRETTFRQFNMVYPTSGGVIDTIAWEGFREGIDDVRYATLLKQRVRNALASGSLEQKKIARKALLWLELVPAEKSDLNEVRQEMIEYILQLEPSAEEE